MENETLVKVENPHVKVNDLKISDHLSRVEYYEVVRKDKWIDEKGNTIPCIIVKNREGFQFGIEENIVENEMISCSQYDEEKKVTRTELVEIFTNIGDTVFTVNFNKQMEEKSAKSALYDLYANKGGKILSEKDYQKEVNKVLKTTYKGEERTLIGYKIGGYNALGRTEVVDLEIPKDPSKNYATNIRQIDHRTLNWLIYKRVKYVVKSK